MRQHLKESLTTLRGWLIVFLMSLTVGPQAGRTTIVVHPMQPKDLIAIEGYVSNEVSTGSGTIIDSSEMGTDVLTNAHVCEDAAKHPTRIIIRGSAYPVLSIKPSQRFDLCLMRIPRELGRHVEVDHLLAKMGDAVLTGGHPYNLPLTIQRGYVSGLMSFSNPPKKEPMVLLATSILVQPGMSGSGVFNDEGKLVGVIRSFRAGNSVQLSDTSLKIGFGMMVPSTHVRIFLEKEAGNLPWIRCPQDARP